MIAITGATGNLGRHVVEQLLDSVDASKVVLLVRSPEKAADFKARGVEVRKADYEDRQSYEEALTGVDKLLLISANEIGKRFAQHKNVIDAAVKNNVGHLVYTSLLHADKSQISLAPEHVETEAYIKESGLTYTLLRNGWYIENYTENIGPALEHGALMGSAGEGKISAATREDFAAAAVATLTSDGHQNAIYELAGDEGFTMSEYAAELSRQSGKEVVYKDMPVSDYQGALLNMGLPEPVATMLASTDESITRGELYEENNDLQQLIGRPTTSLTDVLAKTLA